MRARILMTPMLTGASTVAAGGAVAGYPGMKTYEALGRTTAGAGSATIQIRGRNSPQSAWQLIDTLTLTLSASGGVNDGSDSFVSDDRYTEVNANVTALTGTGATVDVSMGY